MTTSVQSLWGSEFNLPDNSQKDQQILKKISSPKKIKTVEQSIKSKTVDIETKLSIIRTEVDRILGHYRSSVLVITDNETFTNYVTTGIKSGRMAIDTETNNSTDPNTCKIMGLCLYYPGGKQAYIPINHRDPETKEKLSNQLTEVDCRTQLQRIVDSKIEIIMHNGKFDYEVLKCTCGIEVVPTWDTLVAARLIDENVFRDSYVGLKSIYTTYIDTNQEKYAIDHLFENINYADVDPNLFALYAATDSMMTDKVYQWERETFFDLPENAKVLNLFNTIEMPIIQVTAEMELRGVYIDQELGERLKLKYNKQLDDLNTELATIFKNLQPIINNWRTTPDAIAATKQYVPAKTKMTAEKIKTTYNEVDATGNRYKIGKSKSEQLPNEINMSSSTQVAILLYDILGCPIISKKSPRATGEEEIKSIIDKLKNLAHKTDKVNYALAICDNILKRRGILKLITTYIDVIPDLAKHWPDGRIRYKLNSTGTDTGRFASGGKFHFLNEDDESVTLNSINSQNIPSHNPEVRLLFKAANGYRIIGSDYSGQELRLAAYLSQDKTLLDAYANDQDAYAIIASQVFDCPYEDCLEFYPAGTELNIDGQKVIAGNKTHTNADGKAKRSVGKTLVLAGNYGMSGAGAGSLMGKTAKEGTELLDKYFKMFPGLSKAIEVSKEVLKKQGYVEDILGRRRRLPDINLNPYDVYYGSSIGMTVFNPLLNCSSKKIVDSIIQKYINKTVEIKNNKDYENLAAEAKKDGIIIQANTGRIAQAERQCFNARVQGSAGTLTKKAMIDIFNDKLLKQWDAHLIITVHDEVLVECKEEYAELVEKRLPELMINAAISLGIVNPKMKCDPYNVSRWYSDTMATTILKEFSKAKEKGLDRDTALNKIIEDHIELPASAIIKTIETGCDLEF